MSDGDKLFVSLAKSIDTLFVSHLDPFVGFSNYWIIYSSSVVFDLCPKRLPRR